MREFRNQIPVGLVVSPGRDRREELRAKLGLGDREKLVYMYVGRYGQADLAWDRLASYKGIHFVGFHQPPVGVLANFHVVPATEWRGTDLMASTDAAVAKAGYGTVTEAMAAGTPLIFPPRENFAEHAALESALLRWGGGYRVCEHQFAKLEIHEAAGAGAFPATWAATVSDRRSRACGRVAHAGDQDRAAGERCWWLLSLETSVALVQETTWSFLHPSRVQNRRAWSPGVVVARRPPANRSDPSRGQFRPISDSLTWPKMPVFSKASDADWMT